MNTSEQINELAGALSKAQAEMQSLAVDKTNPHFKNKYATLAQVCDTLLPLLAKNGLSVIQPIVTGERTLVVVTRLMHSSGQWLEGEYPIINDTNKPQAMGSAITYARRYSLSAMVCTAPDEDDDANAAQDHGKSNGSKKPGLSASFEAPDEREPGHPFEGIEGTDRPRFRGLTKGGVPNEAPQEYEFLQAAMRAQRDADDLVAWMHFDETKAAVAKLPKNWVVTFSNACSERLRDLRAAA